MDDEVRKLKVILEDTGLFEINYDWTANPVRKPFEENIDQASRAAEAMAKAVMECDILIVLSAEGGIGYHIETGGALVTGIILSFITGQKKKEIYVVGEGNDRSVFYFHRSVRRVPDQNSLIWALLKLDSKG